MKENGFEYVDLGLPSGTMWATCNVGADKPEDPGLLFQFGRVDGYRYGDKNNKFSTPDENKNTTGNEYINPTTSGTIYGERDILKLEDDAAHVNMGGKWIMPTRKDLQELIDNTKRNVVTINDKEGMLFTSKLNGKSIFIPFSGYWDYCENHFLYGEDIGYLMSSEVYSSEYNTVDNYTAAWLLDFYSYYVCSVFCGTRANGYSVRGVLKTKKVL